MPAIDPDAFLRDLYELRKIGQFRTGVHRPTYSPQDMDSRRWLMERLSACGLEPTIDGIGNVYGRHPGAGPHLLVGSHIETQNEAGWLDGALGVMAAVALARAGLPVDVAAFADEEGHFGVVSGIVAIWQWRLIVEGQQDHAGGTTMAERKDAGLAAVRLLAAIDAEFPRLCGERSTWTTGRIALDPGAPSIIPGRAEVLFQFRDVAVPVLERMEAGLRMLVREANRRERCSITLQEVSKAIPALCDPAMMRALGAAAEELAPDAWVEMPSGAGHDAQNIARVMPAAMLFVPSIGGISHHWAEDTKDEDLVLGLKVLDAAARRYLAGP